MDNVQIYPLACRAGGICRAVGTTVIGEEDGEVYLL